MVCGDSKEFDKPHSFPKKNTSGCPRNSNFSSTVTPPDYTCTFTTNFLALNHHSAGNGPDHQLSRTEFSEQPLPTSRWNPTPEQLLALEELYRQGTRTPTAEQIQQIAAKLRRFGKIEGKNVFYWFQNHKARERQKRRREAENGSHEQSDMENLGKKEPTGFKRTDYENEQTKSWVPPSSCSKHAGELMSMHGQAMAESGPDGWTQLEERECQQRRSTADRHATWQNMDLSYYPLMHLGNTKAMIKATPLESKLLSTPDFSSSLEPHQESFPSVEDESRQTQTLELFPLHSNGINSNKKETQVPITTINTNFTPSQYFEFLPLKN